MASHPGSRAHAPGQAVALPADKRGAFTGGVSYALRADGAGGLASRTGGVY